MNATENRPRQIPFNAVHDFCVNIHIFRLLQKLLNFMSFFWVQPRDGWERKIPASQTRLRSFPNQLTPPLVTFDRPTVRSYAFTGYVPGVVYTSQEIQALNPNTIRR